MKKLGVLGVSMGVVLVAVLATAALAQSTDSQSGVTGALQAQGSLDKNAPAAQANAEADAHAKTEADARIAAILAKGAKAPAKARTEAESKIQTVEKEVDAKASSDGDQKVAERLAGDFGMSADAVLSEKQSLGASWGELMIAQTLAANSHSTLTVEQIDQMKKDGNGWGQIAAGMGFKLSDVVAAARAESKVGTGAAKARGKVHPIGHGTLRDENRAADPNPKARAILPESIAKTDTADTSQTDKP